MTLSLLVNQGVDVNSILHEIILNKRHEVELLKQKLVLDETPRISKKSFKSSLLNRGLAVIAEVKRKSPAKGLLSIIADPVELACSYQRGGACAISVLTDECYFGGSIKDLKKIAVALKNTNVTILCKDFIIDPIQIREAVFEGADAVLLIASVLKDKLKPLLDCAKKMNVDVLVEVHDQQDVCLALNAGAEIIGVNNRDLNTFDVDINRSLQLIKCIPQHIVRVSESGLSSPKTTQELYQAGFDAVLVGASLVCSEDPGELIKKMRGQNE